MASTIKVDTIQSTTSNVFFQNSAGTEYARFDASGNFQLVNPTTFPAGTALLPSITATGDTNTGLYFPAADTIAFSEGGVESMRIDSSGQVGIGISPSYPLHINAPLGQVYLNSSTGTNYVRYSMNNSGGGFQYGIDNSAGSNFFGATPYGRAIFSDGAYPIGIFTNGTLRLTIPSDAGGIKFPATQVASSDANTLDDYEEGNYTATITGSTTAGTQTYAGQAGRYTKVGNVVHVTVFVALNSATFTGAMKLSLPFTSVNDSSYGAGCIGYKTSWVTNGPNMFQVENNSAFGYVRRENAAGGTTVSDMAAANITTNTGFMVQVTYQVPS